MLRKNEDFGGQFADGSVVPSWVNTLAWPIVLVAAIIVHQVTGSPIAAASLLAVHAGWKSFRCGLWLKSVDPVANRAWACLWFYLAAAFWRAAAWACVTIMIFVVVEIYTGQPPTEEEIMVELSVLVGSVCLSTAVGLVALTSALRGRVRVWVQPNVREKCYDDFARLSSLGGHYVGGPDRGFNHAIFILATSLVVPILGSGTAILIWSTLLGQPPDAGALPELLGFFLLFPGSLLAIPAYVAIAKRIIAKTPADCWPPWTAIPAGSG